MNELGKKRETATSLAVREIIEGFSQHIGKIGVDDDEIVKEALTEDLKQLQSLFN